MISKKAQLEMSVGTIVTIVLLTLALILGVILTNTIFQGAKENINSIDQSVKSEINKLFAEDTSRMIVIYPPTMQVSIAKGTTGGFGFSIRNVDQDDGTFSYDVSASEIGSGCRLTKAEADKLIVLGKSEDGIRIISGSSLDPPRLVRFNIPESTPLCNIRYSINIEKGGQTYLSGGASVDVEIK
ncbi:hypothetical protein HY449_04475 [Candidatus Pacearchaeota archaeon]|nr:hypothetical protein [Candidatus Pacearchaeota archaeon]